MGDANSTTPAQLSWEERETRREAREAADRVVLEQDRETARKQATQLVANDNERMRIYRAEVEAQSEHRRRIQEDIERTAEYRERMEALFERIASAADRCAKALGVRFT